MWEKAVREQKEQGKQFEDLLLHRSRGRRRSSPVRSIDFDSDTRHATAFTMSDDGVMRERRSGATLRKPKQRFSLSLGVSKYNSSAILLLTCLFIFLNRLFIFC